ncbi:MAG TPA: hypothetical protein VL979_14535 [Solirubrobacteraceae bacterium]|nr:hypothetical protein [Solirubrobacteraceae bacterium]
MTVATDTTKARARFDPRAFERFRFTSRELGADGTAILRYALDEAIAFEERFALPLAAAGRERGARELSAGERERVDGLLALAHWVAGVSYFKTALPPAVACETGAPPPATAALLEALYSEGLGELAYSNGLRSLPRPRFPRAGAAVALGAVPAAPKAAPAAPPASAVSPAFAAPPSPPSSAPALGRVLVPVGGGKDSAVALELVRRSGCETALFSIGQARPIARTAAAAGLPWLRAGRTLDPALAALNEAGAVNGHVPVTAIVCCAALLTAALNGFDAVAMANERSASVGNVRFDGVEVNHQFSKGLRVERLLSAALAELAPAGPRAFSVLRPASELAIARAFARMERYHGAFTSCNAIFRLDPELRASSWCCECPKCRFVYLALAPFSEPQRLARIFGRDLLDEEEQFEGFALLTATGGHKPFECVGEEQESVAALRLLAADARWSGHRVVRRAAAEVLPRFAPGEGDPASVLALGGEHDLPEELMAEVRAVLGA